MSIVKENLIRAKALIDTPEKWCKGTWARDAKGISCNPKSPLACSRCVRGALAFATIGLADYWELKYLSQAAGVDDRKSPNYQYGGIASWQDAPERTHAEVMEVFDKAIKLAP